MEKNELLRRMEDLRGAGKGSVTGTGGTSRKGRLFVYAEILK